MDYKKIVTYSFLAHINNTGILVNDLLDVFKPLIKRSLSIMNINDSVKGESIIEIQEKVNELYKLDVPLTVLRKILFRISSEINSSDKVFFQVHKDNSFQIKNYVFTDFDEDIEKKENEITELEEVFKQYCIINELREKEYSSIYDFIEKNKVTLTTLLAHKSQKNISTDFTNEAKFIEYIKTYPSYYELVKNIYLGSIISTYIEYETKPVQTGVELIFDTNFILSLLDLNSPESTQNCRKLIDICKAMGFVLNVLDITITETTQLLEKKAQYLDSTFLAKKIDPEDLFNACERRNLTKTDLERIANNLEDELIKLGLKIVPNTQSYQNQARLSSEYDNLKKYRNTPFAALHDATALYYVRSKRKNKKVKDFDKATCWFVNNSSYQSSHFEVSSDFLPETLKAEDMLNILWLSNPNIKSSLSNDELTEIGLTRLISCTLNESLPKASVIRELEDNIQKYAVESISDKDVVRIATRIANRSLTEKIEVLNNLAQTDNKEFTRRIQLEAKKESDLEEKRKNELKRLIGDVKAIKESHRSEQKRNKEARAEKDRLEVEKDELLNKVNQLQTTIKTLNSENEDKVKEVELRLENKYRALKREEYINRCIRRWKSAPVIALTFLLTIVFVLCLYISSQGGWNLWSGYKNFSDDSKIVVAVVIQIVSGIIIPFIINIILLRWHNESNINAYKTSLEKSLPPNLKDL